MDERKHNNRRAIIVGKVAHMTKSGLTPSKISDALDLPESTVRGIIHMINQVKN